MAAAGGRPLDSQVDCGAKVWAFGKDLSRGLDPSPMSPHELEVRGRERYMIRTAWGGKDEK